jgi:hypothetical protein
MCVFIPFWITEFVDLLVIDSWDRYQRFLLADNGNPERILIFSTQQNLTHFTAADIIYGDGTFYTCPDVFTQLYTFHTYVDGTMYPLVYALLPGKSEKVYTRFLTLLKQACDQHQLWEDAVCSVADCNIII